MGSVVCDNLLKFKSIKLERNFHTKPPCIMSQILSLELRTFPVSFNSHKHWLLGNCLRTLMSTSIPFIALFYYLNSWFQKCNLLLHLSLINIQKKSCCIQYTQPFISYFPLLINIYYWSAQFVTCYYKIFKHYLEIFQQCVVLCYLFVFLSLLYKLVW